jgi:hypothetical protein
VPFVWPAVDGYWYLRDEPVDPAVLRRQWLDELDQAAATDDAFFLVVCHAFVTGVDQARRDVLRAVIERALADERVSLMTIGEVAAGVSP